MKPRLITIAGGSGSGKSYLASMLQAALVPNAVAITLDHFYHDLVHLCPSEREVVNFDHPQAIDWDAIDQVLSCLITNRHAEVPRYDFSKHIRHPECDVIAPAEFIILEGLWPIMKEKIRLASTLTIFIKCPAEIRLQRRIDRDCYERGRSEQSVRRQFHEHVAPMHDIHVEPQGQIADLIVPHDFSQDTISTILHHPRLLP